MSNEGTSQKKNVMTDKQKKILDCLKKYYDEKTLEGVEFHNHINGLSRDLYLSVPSFSSEDVENTEYVCGTELESWSVTIDNLGSLTVQLSFYERAVKD